MNRAIKLLLLIVLDILLITAAYFSTNYVLHKRVKAGTSFQVTLYQNGQIIRSWKNVDQGWCFSDQRSCVWIPQAQTTVCGTIVIEPMPQ